MANIKLQLQLEGDQAKKEVNGNEVYEDHDPVLDISKARSPIAYYSDTSGIQTKILKKFTKLKRPLHYESKDVTWKEPVVAETKFLPTGWMKVPVVPKVCSVQPNSPKNTHIKSKNVPISADRNGKGIHVTDDKQVSIRFTRRTEKIGKSYKRNNGRKNNNEHITNVNFRDNSSSDYRTQVTKTVKSNDVAAANKMESEYGEEIDGGYGMSAITLKSQIETRASAIDAPSTSRNRLSKQTPKHESEPSYYKVTEKTVAKEFVIQQNPVTLSSNSKKVVEIQRIATTAISPEYTGFNPRAEATLENEFNIEAKCSWANEARHRVVDDAFIYSICKEDLNENAIVNAATQKHAKFCSHNDIKGEDVIKDDEGCYISSFFAKMDGTSNRSEENLVDFLEKDCTKKQLVSDAGKEITSLEKCGLQTCTKADVDNNNNNSDVDLGFCSERKSSKLPKLRSVESFLQRLKPPALPEFGVCTVLPGTLEWEKYWGDFSKKLGDYYSSVENYSKQMDDLLVGVDGSDYKKELSRRYQEEIAEKLSMGMSMLKPPLFRHPLKDTVEIGGYVIRPLGGVVAKANISTFDHRSFRLEIPFSKIDSNLDEVVVDTKFNMMTITIPQGEKTNHCLKLVQISVPSSKKAQNLEIGHPLHNGGNLVIVGK